MPVFDGQLVLGAITIISVVSCTTVLMVCIISFSAPEHGREMVSTSEKGLQDDIRGSAEEGFGENHSYGIDSALFVAWQSMAVIESKLLP